MPECVPRAVHTQGCELRGTGDCGHGGYMGGVRVFITDTHMGPWESPDSRSSGFRESR